MELLLDEGPDMVRRSGMIGKHGPRRDLCENRMGMFQMFKRREE